MVKMSEIYEIVLKMVGRVKLKGENTSAKTKSEIVDK